MINSFGVKFSYYIIIIIFILGLLYVLFKRKRNLVLNVLLITFIFFVPIFCNAIDLLAPDTRIMLLTSSGMVLCIPFMLVFVNNIGIKLYSDITDKVCTLFAITLLCSNILICNADAEIMKINKNITLNLANRVYYSVSSNDEFSNTSKIMITGSPTNNYWKSELSEKTNKYANWGLVWSEENGSINCWNQIFKKELGVQMNWCSLEEYKKITETDEYLQMSTYPHKDSIKVINNSFVVKLS